MKTNNLLSSNKETRRYKLLDILTSIFIFGLIAISTFQVIDSEKQIRKLQNFIQEKNQKIVALQYGSADIQAACSINKKY